ncbi:MAG: phage head closure protein [Alphaproteobacteria bacterium]
MSGDNLASRLDQRVTIQQPERTADGYGGATVSWSDVVTVFADVQAISSGSSTLATSGDEITAKAGYRVSIRARDGISANMRLAWNAHTLTIHSINETATTLEILAYEEMV